MKQLLTSLLFICAIASGYGQQPFLKAVNNGYAYLTIDENSILTISDSDKICMIVKKGDTTIYDSACAIRQLLKSNSEYQKTCEKLWKLQEAISLVQSFQFKNEADKKRFGRMVEKFKLL